MTNGSRFCHKKCDPVSAATLKALRVLRGRQHLAIGANESDNNDSCAKTWGDTLLDAIAVSAPGEHNRSAAFNEHVKSGRRRPVAPRCQGNRDVSVRQTENIEARA